MMKSDPYSLYHFTVNWRPDLSQLEVRWGSHLMTP